MLSSDKNVETIAQLAEIVKHYLGIQTEYLKLDVVDTCHRVPIDYRGSGDVLFVCPRFLACLLHGDGYCLPRGRSAPYTPHPPYLL